MSPARRRDSFSKEFKLKRSVSTPNVRPQGTNEVDQGSSGVPKEKRRNKLGYHRTPIACGKFFRTQQKRSAKRLAGTRHSFFNRMGTKVQLFFRVDHCRKRKIRCKQPETPDVLGRCESCINLQRECVYSAVNQQPPPPMGQRQGTIPSVGSSLASPSTSPAMPAGHLEARPYHQLATIPSMSDIGQQAIKPGEDETYSSEPKSRLQISRGTPSSSSSSSTPFSPIPRRL